MVTVKLALQNIIVAGFRTWLNVFILSLALVAMEIVADSARALIRFERLIINQSGY